MSLQHNRAEWSTSLNLKHVNISALQPSNHYVFLPGFIDLLRIEITIRVTQFPLVVCAGT